MQPMIIYISVLKVGHNVELTLIPIAQRYLMIYSIVANVTGRRGLILFVTTNSH